MTRKLLVTFGLALVAVAGVDGYGSALSQDRWTDATPHGVTFNDYDPNFHASFVPRVQERERIKIHLVRGNQLRVRMVLSNATLYNYLLDQIAKHDLYQEVIEKEIITLTSNTVWGTRPCWCLGRHRRWGSLRESSPPRRRPCPRARSRAGNAGSR